MFKPLPAMLVACALTACVAPDPIDTGNIRQIGQTRQFTLANGDRLNVTPQGAKAILVYPDDYPLTDAEAASYIQDGTGCRAGALIDSFDNRSNRATNRTYALDCR